MRSLADQRPDAQALADAGITAWELILRLATHHLLKLGRPETAGTRLFVSAGTQLAEDTDLYFHGNYADTEGRYRFFYRNPGILR